jgi:hypothetical protein
MSEAISGTSTIETSSTTNALHFGNPEIRVGVRQLAEGVDLLVGVNLSSVLITHAGFAGAVAVNCWSSLM